MRVKGVVEKIEGTKLVIELTPRVIIVKTPDGKIKKEFAWEVPEKIPKEGSVVRINFHARDSKKVGIFEKLKGLIK